MYSWLDILCFGSRSPTTSGCVLKSIHLQGLPNIENVIKIWSRTEQTFALKFSQPIPISTHHCVCECVCVRVCTSTRTPSCPTLCVPLDCSLPGSSVCGIFQTRIRELVAISFSRGSSQPRDRTYVSCLPHWQVGSLPAEPLGKPWATRDAHCGSFTEIWNP